ncbi:MAG TPA: DMT family transporter [Kiloniellales bacterium]|nr:DMT family transporter [Kiloniellales bacterium]
MRSPHYRLALAALLVATLFTSTAGVLVRWIESADGWTVLFWRALFFVLTLFLWVAARYRGGLPRAVLRTGWPGVLMASAFALATITFIFALLETTVAKVVLISGCIPFVTALLAWVVLGERVSRSTVAFMVLAFAGIAWMVGVEIGSGALAGDLLAASCSVMTACMYIAIRRRTQVDMVPAILTGGLLVALVALPLGDVWAIGAHDLMVCALLGVLQLGVQYILVAFGTRHVPAAEAALTARMTIILGPLWAWIGFAEVPSEATFWGGALVLAAIFGNGLWSLRRSRPLALSTAAGPAA